MKKLLLTTIIALITISVFASPAKQSLNKTTGTTKRNLPIVQRAKFEFTGELVKATLFSGSITTDAYYTNEGEFVGTGKPVSIDNLPIGVKRNLAKEFIDFTVKAVIQFDELENTAYLLTAESNKQSVILKVDKEKIEILKMVDKN